MSYCFDAKNIFSEDDGFMLMLGFADKEVDPSRFVILQKAHEFSEQDKETGMDKIHIQVEDESKSQYGGISAIGILDDKITISVTDETQLRLGIDGGIEISFDGKNTSVKEVISQLKKFSEDTGVAFTGA